MAAPVIPIIYFNSIGKSRLCALCNNMFKKRHGRYQRVRKCEKQTMREQILSKLNDANLVDAADIYYHERCFGALIYKKRPRKVNRLLTRAKADLVNYVKEEVLENNKTIALVHICNVCNASVRALAEDWFTDVSPTTYSSDAVLRILKSKLPLVKCVVVKKYRFLYYLFLDRDNAHSTIHLYRNRVAIKKNGYEIRRQLNEKPDYRDPINIPDMLFTFIEAIICGRRQRKYQSKKMVKVIAICNIIIQCAFGGKKPTPIATLLGSAIKTLTNSRIMIDLLHQLGFSISYASVEEMETEMAYKASSATAYLPQGLKPYNNLYTHAAFDNFDRFVETCDGKNTLHDTMGIVVQHCGNIDSTETTPVAAALELLRKPSKRKLYVSQHDQNIIPFTLEKLTFPALNDIDIFAPANFQSSKFLDIIWMLNNLFNTSKKKIGRRLTRCTM